jgi:hypothetical protein
MSLVAGPSTERPRSPQVLAAANRASRVLQGSLRLFGSIDLLAVAAVAMPQPWMRQVHEACDFGPFPEGGLTVYLARSHSLLFAFHGALLWAISADVVRYRPLIGLLGAGAVTVGTVQFAIDAAVGVPWWWQASEGPVFAGTGLWLLYWWRRAGIVPGSRPARP